MHHISAKHARNHFAELIDNAQHEPIMIQRHGRSVAVVLSAREFEEIQRERLRARLAEGEAQLDAGNGIDQSAREIIKEHKAQLNRG